MLNDDEIIASARSVVEAGIALLSTKGALQKHNTGKEKPMRVGSLLLTMRVNFGSHCGTVKRTPEEEVAREVAIKLDEEKRKSKDNNAIQS